MKKNTSILKKELLERNRNILKALHDLYDFDFQADFDILKIKGRFTANSIKKLLNIKDFDDHNVCLILCDDFQRLIII